MKLIFLENTSTFLYVVFGGLLTCVLLQHPLMFIKRHGRFHALVGLFHLFLLFIGCYQLIWVNTVCSSVLYDSVLGISGIVLTLTAAIEFQHKNIKNVASGTLDEHATVTYNEMIEHSFYQWVNLCQVFYLHLLSLNFSTTIRLLLTISVTSPWIIRDLFPVNRFSDNYLKMDHNSTSLIRILYRVKKYQYVFYKHFLLHGLNISGVLDTSMSSMAQERYFRAYWLLLNTSYVMEFFLQTLVKKRRLSQGHMLAMQQILMLASTLAALNVLSYVNLYVAGASLAMNFLHRKHDLLNTAGIAALCVLAQRGAEIYYSSAAGDVFL
jgi:hypothetical protein